ncbi:hypothetical protein KW805_02430 [Candidatus Pacearchaeota archaeon]|nr:hypothetical protein [Candidatus Pacearchaeota archaeon]
MAELPELTKWYVDQRLGEHVSVNIEGNVLEGLIGYDPNERKLAVYSRQGKLLGYIKSGSRLRFTSDKAEFIFPNNPIVE